MGLWVSSPPIDHLTIEPHSGLDLDVMKQIVQHVGGGGGGGGGRGGGRGGGYPAAAPHIQNSTVP